MVMYSANFFLIFLMRIKKFQNISILTLYILLMHVIEYYFYVNWNIVIEVWNISY